MSNRRLLSVIWAFLENLLFGGLVHGWGSLVFVLKSDQVFSTLCNDNAEYIQYSSTANKSESVYGYVGASANSSSVITCVEQDSMLALAFTVAMSFLCIGCAAIGVVYLRFGTRVTRILSVILFISGSIMVAFVTRENPWLIFPGLMLVGIGGLSLLVTNMQISYLFATKSAFIVGLFCGAFDTSSGVQFIMKIAHENGISIRQSYIFLACLHGTVLISTFCFLPTRFIPSHEVTGLRLETMEVESVSLALQDSSTCSKETTAPPITSDASPASLWRCIFSPSYVLHMVWSCLLQLRFMYYLAALNPHLNTLLHNDVAQVSFYTNVSMYMFMTGIVLSPLTGLVYDWQNQLFRNSRSHLRRVLMPSVVPLMCGTGLALLLTALSLVSSTHMLYLIFLTATALRSFLYTMTTAFISAVFPNQYFGILYGILVTVAGAVLFLQYELVKWAQTKDFNQVNWFFVAVVLTSLVHPIYQWFRCRRAEAGN